MNFTKKLVSIALTSLLTLPLCAGMVQTKATYSLTEHTDKAYTVADKVEFHEYDLSSCVYDGVTVTAYALDFSMEDYMILPYAGTAGGAAVLKDQYDYATAAGYDVVAVINGSFFSTDPNTAHGNYGYMNDYIVSNGVIYSADYGMKNNMLCIDSEGNMTNVPKSQIGFSLYFNGVESSAPIAYVNKSGGFQGADNWGSAIYYFDSHAGNHMGSYRKDPYMHAQALTYACCPGYEIVCRKLNGTDLTLGGALNAEIVEIKENSYGSEIAEDEFILFMKADSVYLPAIRDLKAGDEVLINATEMVEAAADITSHAMSITSNIGYLVIDGKDYAATDDFNVGAPHSNKVKARWTAFGVKENGDFVFFTNKGADTGENGNVTLQDVSKAMIELGCVTAIRYDGGGSTAMYVCNDGSGNAGYIQNQGRPISDCMLLVRRTSKALQVSEDLEAQLAVLIQSAEGNTDPIVAKELSHAKAVAENAASVSGDYLLAVGALKQALSGKQELKQILVQAAGISYSDYSEYVLQQLREAYRQGSALFGSADATAEEVAAICEKITDLLSLTGDVTIDGNTYQKVEAGIYVTGMNLYILTDYCSVYTPGTNVSGVNLNWSRITLARYNEKHNAYVVELNWQGSGDAKAIVKKLGFEVVPDDCIVIGTHGDAGAGAANKTAMTKIGKGHILNLHGIDPQNASLGVGYYLSDGDIFAHTEGDWEITKEPASGENGERVKKCTVCGEILASETILAFDPCDVNHDGSIDIADYVRVKKYYLETLDLSDEEAKPLDVNQDGVVDSLDYLTVKKTVLSDE